MRALAFASLHITIQFSVQRHTYTQHHARTRGGTRSIRFSFFLSGSTPPSHHKHRIIRIVSVSYAFFGVWGVFFLFPRRINPFPTHLVGGWVHRAQTSLNCDNYTILFYFILFYSFIFVVVYCCLLLFVCLFFLFRVFCLAAHLCDV